MKLRIGDMVSGGTIHNRATVIQQNSGRPVQFEIMAEARQILLGHTNIDYTVRYLGIDVDHALTLPERTEI